MDHHKDVSSHTLRCQRRTTPHHRRLQAGGLSGRPLLEMSTEMLRDLFRLTRGKLPIVGVGGVGSGRDAYAKIRAGASLMGSGLLGSPTTCTRSMLFVCANSGLPPQTTPLPQPMLVPCSKLGKRGSQGHGSSHRTACWCPPVLPHLTRAWRMGIKPRLLILKYIVSAASRRAPRVCAAQHRASPLRVASPYLCLAFALSLAVQVCA